jgi:hypothetical protein
MNLCRAAALALALLVFGVCAKPLQANAGTATCGPSKSCHLFDLSDAPSGCYSGLYVGDQEIPKFSAELCLRKGTLRTLKITSEDSTWNAFFDQYPPRFGQVSGWQFNLYDEGYLRGVATRVYLFWKSCQTTIPDHKRIICKQWGSRINGPDPEAGSPSIIVDDVFTKKVMYYLVKN